MSDDNLDTGFRPYIKKTFYDIPQDKLTTVFAARNSISNETKLITAIHNLFPGSHSSISYNYEKGTFDCLPRSMHVIPGVSERSQYIIATVAAVFSEICCAINYLHKRALVVCKSCRVLPPSLTEFVTYIRAISWYEKSIERNFKVQMGWIVAINKQGNINPEVHESQIMTNAEYKIKYYDTTTWALALLSEARTVYLNYQMKHLWTGINIVPKIKSAYRLEDFIFASEIAQIENIVPCIFSRPYIGLNSDIPKHLHMFSHARIIFIGMLYHNRVNSHPAKHMSTWEIWEYIKGESRAGDYFKKQCEIIARRLPIAKRRSKES